MNKVINIVLTCTSRKTLAASPRLQLRNLHEIDVERRAQEWIKRAMRERSHRISASDLYCGEYWSVARSLPQVANEFGIRTQIWICSAGYGLIHMGSQICSYSATFSPYDIDSVTAECSADRRSNVSQHWWQTLGTWSGPEGSNLRTLKSIAQMYPGLPILVVASSDYLTALEEDLSAAIASLANADLLMIVSAGTRKFGRFSDHLLPCDARLQACLGGTRGSLNIRIAKRVLQFMHMGPIGLESQKMQLGHLLVEQPPVEKYNRRVLSDEEVTRFIRFEVASGTNVSRTALLRKLRDGGRACEQVRFARLYRDTVIDERAS